MMSWLWLSPSNSGDGTPVVVVRQNLQRTLQTGGTVQPAISLLVLGLAVLLLLSCASSSSEGASTAEPCVVESIERGLPPVTVNELDAAASPDYCNEEQMLADYLAAIETALWYEPPLEDGVCEEITPPTSYPETLVDDLADHYAGTLLAQTRRSIYHNQTGNPPRIVLACWDLATYREQIDAEQEPQLEWSADGRHVIMTHVIRGYTLLTYEASGDGVQLIASEADTQLSDQRIWKARLLYDEAAGRWKIFEAENIVPSF